MSYPSRCDVWVANLSPTLGHEQAGVRPVLVLSRDTFNASPADLVVVAAITTTRRAVRTHIEVAPPEGGLRARSFIMCEQLRCIARERLTRRVGAIEAGTMVQVEAIVRMLLGL